MSDDKGSMTSPTESVEKEAMPSMNEVVSESRLTTNQGEKESNDVSSDDKSQLSQNDECESEIVNEDLKLLKEKVQGLEKENERLATEVELWKDKYYRALAEYHNYQKRVDERIKFERQKAQEEIILKILPIIDAIERATSTTTIDTPIKQVIQGFKVIHRQIQQQLNRMEVTEIVPKKGTTFNPELHEALLSEESDEHPAGTILEVLEKGYRFNSRVIRPAKVKVARPKQ